MQIITQLKKINILIIIILFLHDNFLMSQGNTKNNLISTIKKQLESGQLSPAGALNKAQEAGATPAQIQMAKEQMQSGTTQKTGDTVTEQGTTSDSEKVPEQIIEQQDILEEEDENNVTNLVQIKKDLSHFGYNFFKGAPSSFQPVRVGPVSPDYQVGPGDELVINLWGDTEIRYTLTVSREGTIYIDNVGQIIVNGLTIEKLEKKIMKILSRVYESLNPFLGNPTTYLDVTLGKLQPITVFFLGEMKQIGAYQVDSYSTAFTALYYVGGPTIKGSLRDIQVIRNGNIITHFDLYDYLLTGKKVDDLRLQNEDHIFIPPRGKTVTLQGEILHPGIFELKDKETLRELIEFSGGLLTEADLNRVQVERVVPFEERTEEINIRTVLDYEFTTIKKGQVKVKGIVLTDLDLVTVFPILDPQMDYVTITGAVFRSGKYALEGKMTINNLIEKTQGYLPDAYLEKANLTRTYLDGHTEHFDINLNSLQADTLLLQDWDLLHIYSIWDLKNKENVTISGHIWRPGQYTLHDSMKISDLLHKAGGLDDLYYWKQTFQKRADLIRYNDDQVTTRIIPIKLDSLIYGDKSQDLLIKHRDKLEIYSIDIVHVPEFIEIKGEVKKPGRFNLDTNMKIHDLILRAGGFTKSAYLYEIEIHRIDPLNITTDTLSVVHKLSITPEFLATFNTPEDFKLQNRDVVIIRQHPDFQYQRNVSIRGEIKFPGSYSLTHKGETIRELIIRSGGLKEEAFIDGIQFTRLGQNLSGDFNKILFGRIKYDIPLIDGDEITVPKTPGIIRVNGMVNNPGLIQYQKGWGVQNYISAAGGFHKNADKSLIDIYYASGEAKGKGWIFYPQIKDGSQIIVGSIDEKEDIDWTELLKETTSILASLATVIFIVSR